MMNKWTRYAPGLYVDPSQQWVISREDRNWYSIRACLGFGYLLDGVTLFPDMGGDWYGDYNTLARTKAEVERMVTEGVKPSEAERV